MTDPFDISRREIAAAYLRHWAWRTTGFTFIRQRYEPDNWTVHFHGRPHWDEEAGDYLATSWRAPVSFNHQRWPKYKDRKWPHSWSLRLWRFHMGWSK